MKKRVMFLLLALLLALGAVNAAAAETTGSITVTPMVADDETKIVYGCTFTLYRVADAVVNGRSITYALTDDFSGSGVSPDDISDAALPATLAAYASTNSLTGTTVSADPDGAVRYSSLPPGLYLLVQVGVGEGNYVADPLLVCVPTVESNGSLTYDVTASPKAAVSETVDVTVTKVWNDDIDPSKLPSSVTVSLYDGTVLQDTVTLSAANNWTYTWSGMPASDSYSVSEQAVTDYVATYSHTGYNFTVTNTPKLAQTGQLNWPVPLLAGCGVLLFGLGWALVNRKRSDS